MNNKIFTLWIALVSFSLFAGEVADKKMVWAHYVPWHTPQNTSLDSVKYYNFPLCDSSGNAVTDWKKEYAQAKAQGINGFFPDLVASKGNGPTAFVGAFGTMLKAAEGTDFQVGACLDVKTSVSHQVKELKRILDLYAKHPNFPRWKGRPVICTYTFTSWTPEELAEIKKQLKAAGYDIFLIGNLIPGGYGKPDIKKLEKYLPVCDMIYGFGFTELNGMSIKDKAALAEKLAEKGNIPWMSTVYPGYYGAWLNGRNDFYQVHDGLDQAHRTFQVAKAPRALWMHYTTWNDHDETSFLPMIFTPGNVLITKVYSQKFKDQSTITGTSEVVFAYHREELPGTLLRFEAMTLPTVKSGTAVISGKLLSSDGHKVAKLEKKNLNAADFDRTEWLIPSAELGKYSSLTPEFTIKAPGFDKTVRLPEMLLVSGWHQNAVTVKVAASKIADVNSNLQITQKNGTLNAAVSFESPAKIKRVTLWRNDRPLALFSPKSNGKALLNLYVSGKRDFTVEVENGKIIRAVRKFGVSQPWNDYSYTATKNQAWTPTALCLAGNDKLNLTFKMGKDDGFSISAAELAKREFASYGGLTVKCLPVDATMQNSKPLDVSKGSFSLAVFTRTPRNNDRLQLCFQTMDDKLAWSVPVYPFAKDKSPLKQKIVQTATNLDTPSGATGCKGHNEFLTKNVPFRKPKVIDAVVSPLGIRRGYWDFENGGQDLLGDMPVNIPASMIDNGVLKFNGKNSLKMRLRTYPVGAMTLELKLKPEGGRKQKQGIVNRIGWSDAVELFLLPDGHLEVCRSGNDTVPKENFISKQSITDGKWNKVRITCDNAKIRIYIDDKLDSEHTIAPARSYGNCKWIVGQGYIGELDDLKVLGAAFAPNDFQEPASAKGTRFKPVLPLGTPVAIPGTEQTGSWKYLKPLDKVESGAVPIAFPVKPIKQPILVGKDTLLLGPGANTIKAEAEGFKLEDGCMISVPLLRFDRAQPQKGWYAVMIYVADDGKKSFNFNIGSNKQLMISANEPKWKIKTGHFPISLPVNLKIAKLDGMLYFMIDDRVIYKTAGKEFSNLRFYTSSPNCSDATILQIGAPVRCKVK